MGVGSSDLAHLPVPKKQIEWLLHGKSDNQATTPEEGPNRVKGAHLRVQFNFQPWGMLTEYQRKLMATGVRTYF